MITKNPWIKKYDYVLGLGYIYFIADFKKIQEVPHLVVHEILVDYKTLEEHTYEHKAYKYDLSEHLEHEIPLEMVVHAVFDRHKSSITANIENRESRAKEFLPLKEIDSGGKALYDLQFTQIFNELKVQILKESRSDSFSNILNGLVHLPLRVARGKDPEKKAKSNTLLSGLVGTDPR